MKFTTFGAPSPRNVTLRKYTVHGGLQMTNGTLTLVGALFQEAYICASDGNTSRDYNSRPQGPNFHAELFPVHSPLLRESCLVSYPPLTYMLKFSGFADLTSCQGSGRGVEPRRGLTCRGRATVTGGEGRVLLVVHRRRANTLHASRARSTLVHRRGLPTR